MGRTELAGVPGNVGLGYCDLNPALRPSVFRPQAPYRLAHCLDEPARGIALSKLAQEIVRELDFELERALGAAVCGNRALGYHEDVPGLHLESEADELSEEHALEPSAVELVPSSSRDPKTYCTHLFFPPSPILFLLPSAASPD
jgi:hypothetical protein